MCRCLFRTKFPVEFVNEKCSPEMIFMALYCLLLFIQNMFLLHQQLVIVLVARIRLLWILEVLVQSRRRHHHRRFHPHWIFSSPFEIHLRLQRHFPEILFRRIRNMRMVRDSFQDLLRLLICSEREHSREVIRSRSLRNLYVAKFDDPMTDGCQGTKDFLA